MNEYRLKRPGDDLDVLAVAEGVASGTPTTAVDLAASSTPANLRTGDLAGRSNTAVLVILHSATSDCAGDVEGYDGSSWAQLKAFDAGVPSISRVTLNSDVQQVRVNVATRTAGSCSAYLIK